MQNNKQNFRRNSPFDIALVKKSTQGQDTRVSSTPPSNINARFFKDKNSNGQKRSEINI